MKNKLFIAALAVIAFSSCDKDIVVPNPDVNPAQEAFNTLYPTAYDVTWSVRNGYDVADFMLGGTTTRANYDDQNATDRLAEAWFTTDGGWQMTETDIRYTDLPDAVKRAFEASEYDAWRVDDVDKLENPNTETMYVIDVELGNQERDLYYSADGVLVKDIADDVPGEDDHYNGGGNGNLPPAGGTMIETDIRYADLPQAVRSAFEASEYGTWTVDDADKLVNSVTAETIYVIDVELGGQERDLYYSADGVLIKDVADDVPGEGNGSGNNNGGNNGGTLIETDIRYADLPQAVRSAFEASEYGTWTVDDADKLVNSVTAETIYVIDVELGGQERDLYYSADGVLIKDVADDVPGEGNGGGNNNGGGDQPTTPPTYGDYQTMMENFIYGKYPNARIIGLPDYEYNSVEYDIVDGTMGREVVFNLVAEWQYTETEVRRSDIPQIVMNALLATEYGTWEIDDVSLFETAANGDFYLFEMESRNDQERNVKISIDGTIL
jgi:hypothetical protein